MCADVALLQGWGCAHHHYLFAACLTARLVQAAQLFVDKASSGAAGPSLDVRLSIQFPIYSLLEALQTRCLSGS
eukprot:14287414-Alexandrium_andersonii.AAC.1